MKVSIIIPVYNIERYIASMLDCLLAQTMQDFEVICVDDLSKDDSCRVIENYAKKDTRISLVRPGKKLGAGEARNVGIRYAKGEFLVFLDGDDLFEKNILEEWYSAITEHDCDVAVAAHDIFYGDGEYIADEALPAMNDLKKNKTLKYADKPFSLEELGWEGLLYWYPAPWNRMYRRSFIERFQLEYQNVRCSNDIYFTSMAMMLSSKIIHVKSFDCLIHYRRNTGTQISSNRYPMCIFESFRKIYEKMHELDVWKQYAEAYYVRLLASLIYEITKSGKEEWARKFYQFLQEQGLTQLGVERDTYYWSIDDVIKEVYDMFYTNEYDSRWFETSVEMDMRRKLWNRKKRGFSFTEKLQEKDFAELKSYIDENQWKAAIWENGYRERKIAKVLGKQGIQTDCFYTNRAFAEDIKGCITKDYTSGEDCDLVIVASDERIAEAYAYLRGINKNVAVLNLERYCTGKCSLLDVMEHGEKDMEKQIKVSVVIPVYNVEKYLADCIDSLVRQTLGEIEIICVDDCSTDHSFNILRDYADKDARIHIFKNEQNEGVSCTRGRGLGLAKGKYVYCIDPDDMLEASALEELYLTAEERYADVVYFDCRPIYENERLREAFVNYRATRKEKYPEVYTGRELFVSFQRNWDWSPSVVRLFLKNQLLKEKELKFYPGIVHEDELFTFFVMMESKRSVYMDKTFYIRRFREGSIMTVQKKKKNIEGLFVAIAEVLRYRDANEFTVSEMNAISKHVSNLYASVAKSFPEIDSDQVRMEGLDCDNEYARILFLLFISNTPKKAAVSKWKEPVLKEKSVYIYGSGVYAEKAYANLQGLNVEIKGFVVSDKTQNPPQKNGILVYGIDEISEQFQDTAVIIGVSRKFYAEVKQTLLEHKAEKIIEMF